MKHLYRYKIFYSEDNEELKVSLTPKFHFEIEVDPKDPQAYDRYCRMDNNILSLCNDLKELFNDVRCVCVDETVTYYS